MTTHPEITALASYKKCIQRIRSCWPDFLARREKRLKQQDRHGTAAEKVAENILEDLFTGVLDWELGDINNQVGYADILLTRLGIKYLLIEVKRPGLLAWSRKAVEAALDQALRYAAKQKVKCVAVSDGNMFYAADFKHGGLLDRVFVPLNSKEPQESLWWLSVHGIYRDRADRGDAALRLLPEEAVEPPAEKKVEEEQLLHPKYKVPARCFAYVGDPSDPKTWKLPYCNADGTIDAKRLPKAIQSIISNYRGAKVSSIPEQDIPDVLVRLAIGACKLGKMPHQTGKPAQVYKLLESILEQIGKLEEIDEAENR